jgi:hypothetical protein
MKNTVIKLLALFIVVCMLGCCIGCGEEEVEYVIQYEDGTTVEGDGTQSDDNGGTTNNITNNNTTNNVTNNNVTNNNNTSSGKKPSVHPSSACRALPA